MVENFFYIEGVENEEHLKKKLEEKDSIVEIPKGSDRKVIVPIKRRIAMRQRNYSQKVFVLEEVELPEKATEFLSGYSWIKDEFRFGYYIIDKNGNWHWGQFAPFIPKEDFKDLIEKAKEKGFI